MFLPALIGLAGTAVSAFGTIAGANAQSAALQFQANAARQKGMQEQAAAQRQALEQQRKGRVAQSRLQAVASASGAGASDKTVVDLAGDLAGRATYQAGLSNWQGQIRNWDNQVDANAKMAQAGAVRQAGQLSAFGTLLGGAGSLFRASGSMGGGTMPSADTTFGAAAKPEDDYFNRQVWWAN